VHPRPQEHGNRVWFFEDLKKPRTSGFRVFQNPKNKHGGFHEITGKEL
jgi:hypothetical protein